MILLPAPAATTKCGVFLSLCCFCRIKNFRHKETSVLFSNQQLHCRKYGLYLKGHRFESTSAHYYSFLLYVRLGNNLPWGMDTVSLWGMARQWSGVGPCWEPECHWGPGKPVFLHPVTTSVPHGCEGPPLIGGTQRRSNVNSCCGNSSRMYLVFNSLRIYIYSIYIYVYIYTCKLRDNESDVCSPAD